MRQQKTECLVLLYLREHGGEQGVIRVGLDTLAAAVGRSRQAIAEALSRLEQRGKVARDRTRGGHGRITGYRVLVPCQ